MTFYKAFDPYLVLGSSDKIDYIKRKVADEDDDPM